MGRWWNDFLSVFFLVVSVSKRSKRQETPATLVDFSTDDTHCPNGSSIIQRSCMLQLSLISTGGSGADGGEFLCMGCSSSPGDGANDMRLVDSRLFSSDDTHSPDSSSNIH